MALRRASVDSSWVITAYYGSPERGSYTVYRKLALDASTEYRNVVTMTNATLDRLRQGLKQKRFTLTDIERLSGIRVQRIAEMASEDWGKGVLKSLERLERLEDALDKLEGAR